MNIREKYKSEIEQVVEACRRLGELGYVTSSGGNLSLRVDDDIIIITPTKTPKRHMTFDDICAVNLNGETVFTPEGKKPTGETPFHVRIMNSRPDIKAIVHAHPPVLTGFAIARSDLLSQPFLPEPIIEVGPMLNVEYGTPLSQKLSENFDKVITKSNGFLMENHGALVCSTTDVSEGVEQLQMMEAMAQSVLVARLLGNAETISADDVTDLENVIRIRGLKMPGNTSKTLKEIYNIT
ncbi:MAG: class II aldolase/adducin family protein [Clostridia bacterium]|nr:class II aldolase/adducin family protein [Clostridia bacterium]